MYLPSNFTLLLVQVLFRHGTRVFAEKEAGLLKPEDVDQPLVDEYGFNQLTNMGKNQAYNLGRVLRDHYDKFLGSGYRPEEVYAYSSNTVRTKMSLQILNAALFPPSDEQRWHPNINWMPVPFYSTPVEFDILLKSNENPRFNQVFEEECSRTPEMRSLFPEIEEFSEILQNYGVDSTRYGKFFTVGAVHNIFAIQDSLNRKQVDWYSDDLMVKLKSNFERSLEAMTYTTELKKLFAGTLLKRFIKNLNLNNETHDPRKIYLYSGHDMNIAAVLRSLGIKDLSLPDFSSAIILETFRDSQGRLFLRLIAWTGYRDQKFIALKMRNCDEICHVDDFLNRVKDIIPTDEEIQEMYKSVEVGVRRTFATNIVCKEKN